MSMNTLQRNLAEIRDLRAEEIDLAGGGYSTEGTYTFTYAITQYDTPDGPRTVHHISDASTDVASD